MSTADAFTAALAVARQDRPLRCYVCKALRDMPPDLAQSVTAALDDPNVTGSAIARALTAVGHKVREGSVTRHRRECGTP